MTARSLGTFYCVDPPDSRCGIDVLSPNFAGEIRTWYLVAPGEMGWVTGIFARKCYLCGRKSKLEWLGPAVYPGAAQCGHPNKATDQ